MTMEQVLKEGDLIEMSIYSAFHIRDALSSLLKYLPINHATKKSHAYNMYWWFMHMHLNKN